MRTAASFRGWGGAALLSLAISGAILAFVLPGRGCLEAPGSTAVYDRKGRLLRLSLARDERYRIILPLSAYPWPFVEALLIKEDRAFWVHPGVNLPALLRAAWHSGVAGDYRAGASTITMQVARLVGGYDTGRPLGKLRQVLDALRLELLYSKTRILEAYLSRAPCGGNIEGFEAASLAYFGGPLSARSLSERLLLASLPQRPWTAQEGGSPEALRAARDRLYAAWCGLHPAARKARPEFDLPFRLEARLPFRAPHAVDSLLAESPNLSRIDASLDLGLQGSLEGCTASYVARRGRDGIHNAAALLVDSRSLEVLAEVGSANFFDEGIDGQVNGCEARRSPGSALKPFLYGLAFEEGLITPETILKDAPIHFSGYNPDNFDNDFEGPLSAREALVRSRNVPAVWLLSHLPGRDLYDLLAAGGVDNLRPKADYGVSLTLGTAEVTMRELAALYASLARKGRWNPLSDRLGDSKASRGPGSTLLSPEAAWLVLDILKDKARPEESDSALGQGRGKAPCAWKTGTSIGFKDAWSVGIFGPYVLAVWVGDFEGASNPAFTGLGAAAPLMFEIIDALSAQGAVTGPEAWAERPSRLVKAKVCPVSGQVPTELCPGKKDTWFIPGISPIETCGIHQEVFINMKTGLREGVYAEGRTRRLVMEVWPSDLLALFAQAGLPRKAPPPFAEGEGLDQGLGQAQSSAASRPLIQSPLARSEYVIRSGPGGEAGEMPLLCVVPADASRVFWFLDGDLLGSVPRGSAFFWKPRPGDFLLRATDDRGRSSSLRFKVVLEGQ